MSLEIRAAHDFTCPWCWIGLSQARRLQMSYPVTIRWVGHELYPEALPWPEPSTPEAPPENRPRTLTRLQFAAHIEGIKFPRVERPHNMRVHFALEACEYAYDHGFGGQAVDALYEAYWMHGREIGAIPVILEELKPWLEDPAALEQALNTRVYKDRIVPFDDESYAAGVYNVPTFFIGEERLAEMPYAMIVAAVEKELKK
jgi:predicted DsbA family dithiol-disulfide isomerase